MLGNYYHILKIKEVIKKIILSVIFICYAVIAMAYEVNMDKLVVSMNENSIPIVNLDVDLTKLNSDTFVKGKMTLWDNYYKTSTSLRNDFDCRLRIRGGSTEYYEKKSFAVKLIDDKGEDLDIAIMGIRSENSWILDAMANDRLRMRKLICFDIWNEINKLPYETKYGSRNGTIGYHVEVFINGKYNGLYYLSDKIDRKLLGLKKSKVDKDEITVKGLLYKGFKWGSAKTFSYYDNEPMDTTTWNSWELKVPEDYPSIETWEPLMNLIDFCTGGYDVFCKQWKNFFYADNLIDYMLLLYSFNILDMPFKNAYLSCPDIQKDSRFVITPWDMDASFGQDWNGFYVYESDYYIYADGNSADKYTDLKRFSTIYPFCLLYDNDIDGFRQRLFTRWNAFMEDILSVESVKSRMTNYARLLTESGAWLREYQRWGEQLSKKRLSSTPQEAIKYAVEWYEKNLDIIEGQINNTITSAKTKVCNDIHHSSFVYTLNGMRITDTNNLQNGIYIRNNRKKIIK